MNTTLQDRLFFEDINEALREVVNALGGPKAVGVKLWPEKSMEQAHTLLLNCFNPERRERLMPEQVVLLLRLGREAGCHSAMHYLCGETGYSKPEPLEPEDELARMLREYLDIQRRAANLQPAIEQARLKVAK